MRHVDETDQTHGDDKPTIAMGSSEGISIMPDGFFACRLAQIHTGPDTVLGSRQERGDHA
jgi:hypothetical protein